MNHPIHWRDGRKFLPLMLAACAVILLAATAATVWPHGGLPGDEHFASREALLGAFHRVEPGRTSQNGLVRLGFDPARLQMHTISGLGVQEYFMPVSSRAFDRLDPAIRGCFDAPDRCKVVVFPLAPPREKGGFMSADAAPRGSGRFVFLLKNGRVAYKAVVGS
jgi:hypothetical protein